MSNEERRRKERQKPEVPTSQRFKTASLCVYHSGKSHASSICIYQSTAVQMPSYPLVRRDTDIRFQSIAQRRYFYCFSCRVFFPFVSPRVFVTFLGHFYFCFNLTQARVIWKEGPSSVKMPLWNWFTRAQQTVKNIPPWPLHQLLLPDLPEFQSWLPSVMNNSMEV